MDVSGVEFEKAPAEAPTPTVGDGPVRIDPDLDFIRLLRERGGYTLKKCFQCGTCSGTCALSPDRDPFPRKEIAWAVWGMRDRLIGDPDVWRCHECNDCSAKCPRGGRPGDVLAAVRREVIAEHSPPLFLASCVGHVRFFPLLLAIPAGLLAVLLLVRDPIAEALGLTNEAGAAISYSYSRTLPHWLLNSFFGIMVVTVFLVLLIGARRFWGTLMKGGARDRVRGPCKPLLASLREVLGKAFTHEDFKSCSSAGWRFQAHLFVMWGFLALCVVTVWVFTSGINPLLGDGFVYPFAFWSPWKLLANLGGVALVGGTCLMLWRRLNEEKTVSTGTYPDWALLTLLLLVGVSGFATEIFHYLRFEPHRHAVYYFHLVFVSALLMYLPYSKLAHVVYRTVALVFAVHTGLTTAPPPGNGNPSEEGAERGDAS